MCILKFILLPTTMFQERKKESQDFGVPGVNQAH